MASASSQNTRLTPVPSSSGSPFLSRTPKNPQRGRSSHESSLSLRRVFGTTCRSPTGFDTVNSIFAYIAGGAVVVVDVQGRQTSQRFFRARPAAVPIYSTPSCSTPAVTTPKANDSRNRTALGIRDSPCSSADWADSSRTWTSRERIKAATCLSLSRDAKYLAVGETGYAPRVLIFNLQDASSDVPLVSISEHAFGVTAVAWSADSRYLASLGAANDGYLYIWKIDPRTGAAKLFQQNKCTSYVRDMVWIGNSLVTLGLRHVKVWKIDNGSTASPIKHKPSGEPLPSAPASHQKPLPGRNILLGDLLEATFVCAAVEANRLIVCTETGDVCIMPNGDGQTRLIKVLSLIFTVSTILIRGDVAYVGGRDGHLATLNLAGVLEGRADSVLSITKASSGFVALGFLTDTFVTIDSKQSIVIRSADYAPGREVEAVANIPMPGHGEPIAGVQPLQRPNKANAAFATWSYTGNFTFWDLEGQIKSTLEVPMESDLEGDLGFTNRLTCACTTGNGKLLITADRLGILRVTDADTKKCILDTKAHSSDCMSICIFDDDSKFIMACCGRDRTAQLFQRLPDGSIEHFQTLEFAARVVQVLVPTKDKIITCSLDRTLQIHDLVSKEGEPDVRAAILSRVISLRSSPTSMAMSPDNKTIFVSLADRCVFQFDVSTGRQVSCFKCTDEAGVESTVLESLSVGLGVHKDMEFLLGSSNTDKSVRIYDAVSGAFLDREWGHTEAINGVCIINDDDGTRKIVSVGSDGTIMIWALDSVDPATRLASRDPSPVKEASSMRPTLRKVLSKVELAEFQRPPTSAGRRSPSRTLQRRSSRLNLGANSTTRTPSSVLQSSPYNNPIMEDTPTRRPPQAGHRPESPPPSPKPERPGNTTIGKGARKKASSTSLHGFGTLNSATEQTCRALRAYRKKLSSSEPITADVLTDLDHELRLTATAIGDRAVRSNAINETVLSGLLDEYSERLVTLLDEKLRVSHRTKEVEAENTDGERRRSSTGSSSSSSSAAGSP